MQYNEIEELNIKRYKLLIPNYNDEVFIYTINDSFMFTYNDYRPDISIDLNNFPILMYCIKKLSERLSKFLDIEKIKEGLIKDISNNIILEMMNLRIMYFYFNNYIPMVRLYGFSTDDKDKIEYKFSFYWYISKEIALDISNTCILNVNGKIDYLNTNNEISFFNDKIDLIERSYAINNIDSIINFIFTLLNLKRGVMKYASIK